MGVVSIYSPDGKYKNCSQGSPVPVAVESCINLNCPGDKNSLAAVFHQRLTQNRCAYPFLPTGH